MLAARPPGHRLRRWRGDGPGRQGSRRRRPRPAPARPSRMRRPRPRPPSTWPKPGVADGYLPAQVVLDLFAALYGPVPGADPSRLPAVRSHDGTLAARKHPPGVGRVDPGPTGGRRRLPRPPAGAPGPKRRPQLGERRLPPVGAGAERHLGTGGVGHRPGLEQRRADRGQHGRPAPEPPHPGDRPGRPGDGHPARRHGGERRRGHPSGGHRRGVHLPHALPHRRGRRRFDPPLDRSPRGLPLLPVRRRRCPRLAGLDRRGPGRVGGSPYRGHEPNDGRVLLRLDRGPHPDGVRPRLPGGRALLGAGAGRHRPLGSAAGDVGGGQRGSTGRHRPGAGRGHAVAPPPPTFTPTSRRSSTWPRSGSSARPTCLQRACATCSRPHRTTPSSGIPA